MAQKFFVPVTIQDLSSTGSDAINVFIDSESYARLKLEAGGRLVWGDGTGAGDTNLYRDGANVLKTDDTFKAAALFVDGIEIDTAGATTDNVLKYDGTKFVPGEGGGGASVTVSDTPPSSPTAGDLWYESDTGRLFVYYDSFWVETTSTGPTGPGVATGGTAGQVLVKNSSTDYDTSWGGVPGLELIKTQTVGSGVSSVTVTNAFSADYDNYRIIWTGGSQNSGSVINLKLGSSTTAYYNILVFGGNYTTPTAQGVARDNGANFSWVGFGESNYAYVDCDLFQPYLAKYTTIRHSYASTSNAGNGSGVHKIASSYSDFTLSPDSGGVTMSGGTIRIYGYRN